MFFSAACMGHSGGGEGAATAAAALTLPMSETELRLMKFEDLLHSRTIIELRFSNLGNMDTEFGMPNKEQYI